MKALQLWNAAIDLRKPRASDLELLAGGIAPSPVFATDESLRFLAPNFLFELPLGTRYWRDAEVVNLVLPTFSGYLEGTHPGIVIENLQGLQWAGLELPCDAETLLAHVRRVGGVPVGLVTESDFGGAVQSWKVHLGALSFVFDPLHPNASSNESHLVALTFNYRLPYEFPMPASIVQRT